MDWPDGWSPIDESSPLAEGYVAELGRELTTGHFLAGIPVAAIGGSGDDVLYRLLDGTDRVAVVHLTWAGRAEAAPWPHTALFEDLDRWVAQTQAGEDRR